VTAGTIFHGTRVPLRLWFLGVFFLARHKQGISARQFQRDTGEGTTRRPGRCCTSCDPASQPSRRCAFGNLKTWLRGTFHGVSPKHLQRYRDEFVFRFDRRWQEAELFIRVLHRVLDAAPFPYHRPTAERIG
jgi:hypothetical protein